MVKNRLQKYNERRDFKITSEPKGTAARTKTGSLMFTVQKHDATRLHYDFRLEWGGVLWSWAVPKGPSYYPKDKRLAVRTEDHPLSYGNFEGIIAPKQYGAGPVMLWDTGTWTPLEKDPGKAIEEGKLTFCLKGEKLQGEWTLARMHTKSKSRENWLLIKGQDDKALDKEDNTFLEKTDYSVKTGRNSNDVAANTKPKKFRQTKSAESRDFRTLERKYKSPQLATLVDAPPTDKNWIHEVKYDGYRILVFCVNGVVRIRTRNGHDWTDKFPVLRTAFEKLDIGSFILDGEAVVLNKEGLSDFKALQDALGVSEAPMQGFFFDLLYWDTDYTGKPLTDRRQALEDLFQKIPEGPVNISEIIDGAPDAILEKACALGLEGIISKKGTAKYMQSRSRSWIKSKCEKRQEFIICGFVPASDLPEAIGALHLGFYRGKTLTYAGKVGTGFTHQTATNLYAKLERLVVPNPPFEDKPGGNHDTSWVKPKILCEVKFAMWTSSGKVRHASYQGLREDKAAKDIVKEEPRKMKKNSMTEGQKSVFAGVHISHADRKIFPESNITKSSLAEFYAKMGEDIMPSLKNRPVSIVRCPEGIDKECFFQRSKGKGMPDHIYAIDISHDEKSHEYIYLKNIRGLLELVQMGGIELHPWNVQIDNTEKPDRIVIDLDPDEDVPFEAVKMAAEDVKNRFEELDLTSFLKCTGGKGLHVTVPLQRRHEWDTVKTFCRNFASQMATDVPEAYTTNMSKKKRVGKIFVDYLRNDFASTAVMDYCVRARPGAPVAVPLDWNELAKLKSANQFSLQKVLKRKQKSCLFSYPEVKQSLTKSILNAF